MVRRNPDYYYGNDIYFNIVSFKLALLLKALGFDKDCLHAYHHRNKKLLKSKNTDSKSIEQFMYYYDDCYGKGCNGTDFDYYFFQQSKTLLLAPTIEQTCDWIKEKYNYHIFVDFDIHIRKFKFVVIHLDYYSKTEYITHENVDSPQEVLEIGIEWLLNILKDNE